MYNYSNSFNSFSDKWKKLSITQASKLWLIIAPAIIYSYIFIFLLYKKNTYFATDLYKNYYCVFPISIVDNRK